MTETNEPTGRPRRGPLFKLGISVLSLVVVLAGCEIAARVAGYGPLEMPDSLPPVGDVAVHYRNQENWQGNHVHKGHAVPAHTNRYGHRSPDFPEAKPEGQFRILAVGDSLMFGPGVPDGQIFTHLLQQYYDEHPPEVGEVLVINGAANGYSLPEYLLWARTQIPRFDADVFLLALFTGNDHVVNQTNAHVQVTPWRALRGDSGFARWLDEVHREYKFRNISQEERDKYEGIQPDDLDPEAWDRAMERLKEVREVVREHGAQLVVLLLPIKAWSDPPVDDPDTEDVDESLIDPAPDYVAIRERVEALEVPLIDGLSYIRQAGPAGWLPYDGGHLDVEGHRQIARALVTELREKGIVR